MMFVRDAARLCGIVLLLLSAAEPGAAAQVALSPNGQQINNLVGRGVALADLNGDGTLDAFTVNFVTWQSHDCRVYFGDGKGGFTDSGQRLTAPGPQDQPLVYDLDGNGTRDVLVGRAAWLNDGAGRFSPGPSFLVDADGAPIRDGKLADLNGDAIPDLLVTAMLGGGAGSGVRLYRGDGKGRFHYAWQTTLPGVAAETAIGDLNGDRIPDFVVSGWRNEAKDGCPNRVFLNDGTGQFTDTGQRLEEELRHSHDVVLGDLDRDGDLDMVVVTQGPAPGAQVHLNDGKARFTPGQRFGTTSIEKIALADFDGDGDLDVFLACIGPDEAWLNDGRGAFTDTGLRLGGQAWSWELAVGDINRDGLSDVFVVKFARDSTAPPERALVACPADVWLNTSRRGAGPAYRATVLRGAALEQLFRAPACLEGYTPAQSGPLIRLGASRDQALEPTFTVEPMKIPSDGALINGWLYLPLQAGGRPLIVLTNGGGGNAASIKSFSDFMAPVLAHCGIAAFVHDKRGTGGSQGVYRDTTFDDYIRDTGNLAVALSKRARVDPARVGAMGACEGGRIAVLAASARSKRSTA